MRLTQEFRVRLQTALRGLEARTGIVTIGWTDEQAIAALRLINEGYSARDAAAVVTGDAVLEDGQVDYDPGCAWIDSVLDHRAPTRSECERIVADYEARRDADGGIDLAGGAQALRAQPVRRLHLVY